MSIKIYNPTTNARRNMSVTDYTELSKNGLREACWLL